MSRRIERSLGFVWWIKDLDEEMKRRLELNDQPYRGKNADSR